MESSRLKNEEVVAGRDAICAAYQDTERANEYIKQRYEDDPFGRANHNHQVRLLHRIIAKERAKRLLEVAVGPARLTVHLPRVGKCVGVEQSPAMIRVAEERLRQFGRDDWSIQQGDAFDLPFANGEFDAVLSFKLVRHFDRPDRLRLMEKFRAAVRPGGAVVIDVANRLAYQWLHKKWGLEKGWIDDFWFSGDEFRREALDAGFTDVTFYPVQPAIRLQYYCWSTLWRIWPMAAKSVGRLLEFAPFGQPLEWLAVCRCG